MTGTELATRSAGAVTAASMDLMRATPKAPWMMRIEEHPSLGDVVTVACDDAGGRAAAGSRCRTYWR